MKKIVGAVLVAAAVLSFVGCSKGGTAKRGAAAATYQGREPQIDPATGKVYDFKGMKVTIYDWFSNPDSPPNNKAEEDQLAYRQWLMDTYNFTVVQTALSSWGDHPRDISNIIMQGTKENLVFLIDGRSTLSGLKNNFWYDLGKIKGVDWSNPKWNQGVIDRIRQGDSFYTFNVGITEPKQGMYFNKRILEENGYDPDYPYDLQKEGKWTWDVFEEMCRRITRDTDNDGVIDQYAMSSFYTEFGIAAAYSNGGAKVKFRDGKFVNAMGDDDSMEAWNWMDKMWRNYQLPQGDAQWDYWQTAFVNGETAFCAMQAYIGYPNGALSQMKDDWGWVCFPLGPKSDGKYFTIGDSNMLALPNLYNEKTSERIMKIVDLWTDTVPGYDDEDSWKATGYLQGFRDERALEETSYLMINNAPQRLDTLIPDFSGEFIVNAIAGGWATAQEAYEQEKDEVQARLDAVN